jgi:hypothetical protein
LRKRANKSSFFFLPFDREFCYITRAKSILLLYSNVVIIQIRDEEIKGVDVMGQLFNSRFKWEHEGQFFEISDVDKNFFLCRYLGSRLGFVIDKQVFHKHLAKGKIQSYTDTIKAV